MKLSNDRARLNHRAQIIRKIMTMKSLCTIMLATAILLGCGSDRDSSSSPLRFEASREIVSVSGDVVPAEADLAIVWFQPDDTEFDEYLSTGGRLSDGAFVVEAPDPIPNEVISEIYGVATGLVVAFPKGEAPAPGPYTVIDPQQDDFFDDAIGVVNNHLIVYRNHDLNPALSSEGFAWWGDLFNDGYSCARAFEVVGGFDQLEPAACSSMVLRIGTPEEIEIVGGDWF